MPDTPADRQPDSTGPATTVTHEWRDGQPISRTVIQTIAAHRGVTPIDLPLLYSAVDMEALDLLLDPFDGASRRDEQCHLTFAYDGETVTVARDGEITVGADGDSPVVTIDDEQTFAVALARLVRNAQANGVEVAGVWSCPDETSDSDWRIEVGEHH